MQSAEVKKDLPEEALELRISDPTKNIKRWTVWKGKEKQLLVNLIFTQMQ